MRPTLRTFGGVLSPGLASYQVVTGVVVFHPSSDKSPSILMGPAVREMFSVSPAMRGWACSARDCSARRARKAAAIRERVLVVMPLNAQTGRKPLKWARPLEIHSSHPDMASLHERAGEVFLAALSRPAAERDAFLVDACRGDEALLQEVGSLLMFHDENEAPETDPYADRPAFAAGDLFAGRYRMISRVGRGGMGDVWRADDLTLQTPVALKLMRAASPSDRSRLLQEARLARQITHPAVCRVFDVGEEGETIFFSMEFVQGEDLAALLKRTGRLTSERVIEIARQLCAGLAAAHAKGVLHRDLKPANVLIDQDGQVRITDFGIA